MNDELIEAMAKAISRDFLEGRGTYGTMARAALVAITEQGWMLCRWLPRGESTGEPGIYITGGRAATQIRGSDGKNLFALIGLLPPKGK